MIRAKTVFVVGAGASCEAGLPSGGELKQQIAHLLNIRFPDGYRQESGDWEITGALRKAVAEADGRRGDINPLVHKARQIAAGMPLALSIDNYLDAHRDEGVELCGKLAISKAILAAERGSKLFFNTDNRKQHDFESLRDTWFVAFHQLLTEGVAREQSAAIVENVSIINFNYDRCVEHFLHNALQAYYAVSEQGAADILSELYIFHPYGTVGRLPWQRQQGQAGVPFGGSEGQDLLGISRQIKTFTERVEEGTALSEARKRVAEADVLVFLGFAFHPQNMELLDARTQMASRRVFGTVKGISGTDLEVVKGQISRMLRREPVEKPTSVNSGSHMVTTFMPSSAVRLSLLDVTCSGLFHNYWRSLSQLPGAAARPEKKNVARARSDASIEKVGKAGA